MSDKMKKTYDKAQLKQTRIELGVYGCYGGEDAPNMPIGDSRGQGGLNVMNLKG